MKARSLIPMMFCLKTLKFWLEVGGVQINTGSLMEQNIDFWSNRACYTKISELGVKLHFYCFEFICWQRSARRVCADPEKSAAGEIGGVPGNVFFINITFHNGLYSLPRGVQLLLEWVRTTSISKETYLGTCDFSEGGGGPDSLSLSLDPLMTCLMPFHYLRFFSYLIGLRFPLRSISALTVKLWAWRYTV